MKKIISGIVMVIVVSIFNSCSKNSSEENPISNPTNLASLSTTIVTEVSQLTAKVRGNVTTDGNSTITARGFCFSTTENPTIANNKTLETGSLGTFTSNLTSLNPNTIYFVRTYATNTSGTAYGNQLTFTTLDVANFIKFKYKNIAYSFSPETYDNQKKEIRGYQGSNSQYKKMGIWTPLLPTLGIHNVTYDNSNPNSYEGHFVSQAEGLYLDGTTGTINITSITNTKIEGIFQFSGLDTNGATIAITEGSFKANRN